MNKGNKFPPLFRYLNLGRREQEVTAKLMLWFSYFHDHGFTTRWLRWILLSLSCLGLFKGSPWPLQGRNPYYRGWETYQNPSDVQNNSSGIIQMGLAEKQVGIQCSKKYLLVNQMGFVGIILLVFHYFKCSCKLWITS